MEWDDLKTVLAVRRAGSLAGAGRALGAGIASLAHLFNPELVALGGGVTAAGDLLFGPLREELRARLLPGYAPDGELAVVPSALGDDAGLLGAAALVLESHEQG